MLYVNLLLLFDVLYLNTLFLLLYEVLYVDTLYLLLVVNFVFVLDYVVVIYELLVDYDLNYVNGHWEQTVCR